MSDSKSEPIVALVSPADRAAPLKSKLKGIYLNVIEGLGKKLIEAMSLPRKPRKVSRVSRPPSTNLRRGGHDA